MMREAGFGFKDWSLIADSVLHMVCFSFVDDTDLVNTLEDGNYNIEELLEKTQQALNYWQGGLLATGGTLVPAKSYWTLIDFKCSTEGNWTYRKQESMPGNLYISTPDEGTVELTRVGTKVGNKALGVKNRHDGTETDNIKWFKSKATAWGEKIRQGYLNSTDAWKAFSTTIAKSTEYPLAATCFTEIQCNQIMAPAKEAGLRAAGIQSKMPLALVYSPLASQGLGYQSIYTLQLVEHLQMLLRHLDSDTLTGQLMRSNLESLHMETGSKRSIWQLEVGKWAPLCTKSWMKSTWMDIKKHNIMVQDNTPRLTPIGPNDDNIMDFFANTPYGNDEKKFAQINWCRMYTQTVFISDLYDAGGTQINQDIWECRKREDIITPYKWPRDHPPSAKAIATWQQAIKDHLLYSRYTTTRTVNRYLIREMLTKQWKYRYCVNENRIYELRNGEWYAFREIPNRSRTKTYEEVEMGQLPAETVPATAKKLNNGRIRIDDISHLTSGQIRRREVNRKGAYQKPCVDLQAELTTNLDNVEGTRKWAVKNHNLVGESSQLIEALKENRLIVATDGSHKGNTATAAVILKADDKNYLEVKLQVPGESYQLQSHRAELSGHYAVMSVLEVMEQMLSQGNQPIEGGLTVACDNIASLRVYDLDYIFEPYQEDFDLTHTIQKRVIRSPFQINAKWVKGHQDEGSNQLDEWARMNVQADALANEYRDELINGNSPTLAIPQFTMEAISIWHANKKLTNLARNTYTRLKWQDGVDYWIESKRIPFDSIEDIDWTCVERSIKSLPCSKRKWLVKHASDNCGVGKTMVKWKFQESAECSLCRIEEEDAKHVLQCKSQVATQQRQHGLNEIKKWMDNHNTHPEITKIIITAAQSWANRQTLRIRIVDADVKKAYYAQSQLGWYNFFLGIGVKQWADCQQRYFEQLNKRNTGKRWLIELQKRFINTSWDVWNTRCATRWMPGNYREQQALRALDQAIVEEFDRGIDPTFPGRSTYLFTDYTVDEVMQSTTICKKYWLQSVEAARMYNIPTTDNNNSGYSGMRLHLQRWMAGQTF